MMNRNYQLFLWHILVFERTSSQELPQDRGGWYFPSWYGLDVREEFQQTFRFGVFRVFHQYFFQQWNSLLFQGSQLIHESRVKHDIGLFLVRGDVFLFTGKHAFPSFQGVESRVASVFVIPDHTANQTIVRWVDNVMVINGNYRKCRDEYFEQAFMR